MKNTNRKIIFKILAFFVITLLLILNFANISKAINISTDKDLWELTKDKDDWYGLDPKELIDKPLELVAYSLPYCQNAYCIDPHTSSVIGTEDADKTYAVRHFIDVNVGPNSSPGAVTVYGNGKPRTIYAKDKLGAKSAVQLAYMATEAFVNKEDSVDARGNELGYRKRNIAETFANSIKELREDLGLGGTLTNIQYPGKQEPDIQASIDLRKAASDYSEQVSKSFTLKDMSNKGIQMIEYVNNKSYIGPYRIAYEGCSIDNATIETITGEKISVAGISKTVGGALDKVSTVPNNQDFYLVVDKEIDSAEKVKLKTTNQKVLTARMALLTGKSPGASEANQNLIFYRGEWEDKSYELDVPKVDTGNLTIIKKADGSDKVLQGVGFILKNKNKNQYVKQETNGKISYVSGKAQATEFVTNESGKIQVNKLAVGKYQLVETKVGNNYGYEVLKDPVEVTVKGGTVEINVDNKQVFIKISGYVWQDVVSGKQSLRNNLYHDSDTDNEDKLLEGITVRLKDSSGKVVKDYDGKDCITKTNSNGAYVFPKFKTEQLSNCYVEFEYNGLKYTNVTPNINKNNGSKAAESTSERTTFNNNFASVEGLGGNNGITRNTSGQKVYNLAYEKNSKNYTSKLIMSDAYSLSSYTNETGYLLSKNYVPGKSEIKNINLGLYEREQADLALVKDVQNAKISVNGYEHTYNYADRFKNVSDQDSIGFNMGVKFKNEYTGKYSRPVYKSDVEYNPTDKNKELKISVTYKIAIKNETTNLIEQVNKIVDYYDSSYTLKGIGTSIDGQGNISGEQLSAKQLSSDEEYNKIEIDINKKINPQTAQSIYIQFELSRDRIAKLLNNEEVLENVAEISSYTTFDKNEKIYAAVDVDSNPGNVIPTDTTTYEDDTDRAPGFLLVYAGDREIEGKVFLDSTSNQTKTAQIRQGDGEYKDGETGISGVRVLYTEQGSGTVYEGVTDQSGNFKVAGYIPGDYKLTYIWGDETYNVREYKATVYKEESRQNDTRWYLKTEPRYSDALDNWATRATIDKEIQDGKYITSIMDSTTPLMSVGIEYGDIKGESNGSDKVVASGYTIRNADFGIVERARQIVVADKRVKNLTIILANGQVLVNANVTKDGKLEGQTLNTTYMGPTATSKGFVKVEIDKEILQGATAKINYEISVANNSEKDYNSQNYYNYGKQEGKVITMTPEKVYDFMDKELALNEPQGSKWEMISFEDYNTKEATELSIIETSSYNTQTITLEDGTKITRQEFWKLMQEKQGFHTTFMKTITEKRRELIGDKTIIKNSELSKEIAPGEANKVELNASKVLANTDEIELDNFMEIVRVKKEGGSEITTKTSIIEDPAETVLITPPTGESQNYILPITIGISTLIILGAGVVLIKKKVLNK